MNSELAVLDFIQAHLRNRLLDITMPLITTLGNAGAVWIGCSVVLLLIPKTRKTGAAIAVSLILEVLCCNAILKPLAARIRPCDVNTAVPLLIERPTDFSFPSGHTGASFAATSALYANKNPFRFPALILAILIAFSRLYLYVHYPTDILAGSLLGIMSGWLGSITINATERKRHET